jgi:uncharacterized protein
MPISTIQSAVRAGALAAAAVLLCAAASAPAQTMSRPGKPAPQGQPAPSAAPAAPSRPDDPAKVAAAKEFIVLFHPRMDPAKIAAQIDRFMPGMIKAAKANDPKLDDKKYATQRRAELLAQSTRALDLQAHVVSRHFSLPELKGLSGFYRSPLGRKLTEETPKISMEIMRQARLQMPLNMPRRMGQPVQEQPSGAAKGQTHK